MNGDIVRKATLVMFGGTGDLALRKLLPALFHNWKRKLMVDCLIVAVGRRCEDLPDYLNYINERVDEAKAHPEEWREFSKQIGYHRGEIKTTEDFQSLREKLEELEKERGVGVGRLFYYAVAPNYFAPVTEQLAKVGLLQRGDGRALSGWSRIVVEKPFGHDKTSAQQLDAVLRSHLDESQIFRIDHYLGKETVQNVMALRFANGFFEPVWNYKYVASVQITVAESIGVEDRADYYESAGALRDMMQNHLMQLLALTAMEPPISLDADEIRDEKLKVLKSIRMPQSAEDVDRNTIRGQYGPGKVQGKEVVGYRQEDKVSPQSNTPTYVAARIYVDNWRWANVPFCLRHGKRMAKRGTEIAIQFTTPPLSLFRGTGILEHVNNTLVLRIQPNEGITLHFGAKTPGVGMKLANVSMDFTYEEEFHQEIPEAYERLLLDAMLGDPTLFMRSDEVASMWQWADAIQSGWDRLPPPSFPNYPAGSWGPPEAECLLPHAGEIAPGLCPIGWRRW
jgi:glucose-6-phosphate 1-dehydrogenase